nr:Extra-large GTP-binding protein 3 [Ipomoea batatas]
MADLSSVEKARKQLEDLYLGVPDESVNLTFQHLLVQPTTQPHPPPTSTPSGDQKSSNHSEQPILDFHPAPPEPPNIPHVNAAPGEKLTGRGHHHATPERGSRRAVGLVERSNNKYEKEDMSYVSVGRRRGRRPGVPHSNICTLCTTYIFLFRHRCLVCGRVYCRHCMRIGMGDMPEGRKCVDCLGRRFSPRYIQTAGQTGCWMSYSSTIKQQELKWAEKGPRVKSRNRSSRSIITSTSKSPKMAHSHVSNNSSSFVQNPSYTPYTPTHHYPLPF